MEYIFKWFWNGTLSFGEGRGEVNTIGHATGNQTMSFIGAGCKNTVSGGINGIVVGGFNNTVSGAYSAILGGSGNTVSAGYSHVGIFGQNITNVRSNAFHVNCLIACDTPGPGAYLAGTFFYKTLSTIGPTDKVIIMA